MDNQTELVKLLGAAVSIDNRLKICVNLFNLQIKSPCLR